VAGDGTFDDVRILDTAWINASLENAFSSEGWPDEYEGSPLVGYGFQWWLVDGGGVLALGKDGQYLYIDPAADVVIVRTGTSQGGISWLPIILQVAAAR